MRNGKGSLPARNSEGSSHLRCLTQAEEAEWQSGQEEGDFNPYSYGFDLSEFIDPETDPLNNDAASASEELKSL